LRGVALRFAAGALSSAMNAPDRLAEPDVTDVGLAPYRRDQPVTADGAIRVLEQEVMQLKELAAAAQSSRSVGLMRANSMPAGHRCKGYCLLRDVDVSPTHMCVSRIGRADAALTATRAPVQCVYCFRGSRS